MNLLWFFKESELNGLFYGLNRVKINYEEPGSKFGIPERYTNQSLGFDR